MREGPAKTGPSSQEEEWRRCKESLAAWKRKAIASNRLFLAHTIGLAIIAVDEADQSVAPSLRRSLKWEDEYMNERESDSFT